MALKDLVGAPLTDFPTEEDYALLKRIESPADLRKLPVSQLPEVCRELRAFMLESVSRTGGHLSSSLGATDIAVALHYVFNTPQDSIIWDVGHQAYAHKILTGRREAMKTLRKKGGISGFPKRSESPLRRLRDGAFVDPRFRLHSAWPLPTSLQAAPTAGTSP